MSWFRKPKQPLQASDRRELPADVFYKCEGCSQILPREKLVQNLNVCPECEYHYRFHARGYVDLLVDDGTFVQLDGQLRSTDPLEFTDLKPYRERLDAAHRKGGSDAQ
jgi:acetyl-CoA carboxylase carboxyl transferase subunit beta